MHNNYFPTLPYMSPERSQKFFGVILTLLALMFFGFFAIKPTVSTILQLQKEKKDNEYVLEQLETKIKNLTELRKQYFNLQTEIPTVNSAITNQPDVHLLFAQIQAIAKSYNITVKKLHNLEVEILKNDAKKDHYSFNFSVAGSGSFDNITNFIKTVTNMERVVNIDTLSFVNMGEDQASVSFEALGVAYFKT